MTVYKYLGYGETDESGVAHLEYDADGEPLDPVGYTGVGAGKIDFIASLDNPIESGSIVSETYTTIDAMFLDRATSSDHNDIWSDANSILNRDTDYSYLQGAEWNNLWLKLNNSTTLSFSNGIGIEFDVIEINGALRIRFNDGSNHDYRFDSTDSYDDVGHWKFTMKDGELKAQYNNQTAFKVSDFNTSVSTFQFRFELLSTFQSFKFKNFAIYPI